MKRRILFITSANLATNPRLVKEIDSLTSEYEIDVVLFKFLHWSNAIDQKMRDERDLLNFRTFDVSKRSFINWAFWALVEKTCRNLYPLFKSSLFIAAGASSRKSIKMAMQIKENNNYSLVIAHTISSLYPAYVCASRWNIPFAFDIEDYDPGMRYANAGRDYEIICQTLYKQILPKAKYITSASPLIGRYTLDLIGGHSTHRVILNSFPQKEFRFSEEKLNQIDNSSTIRFVWFSMTISFNRGLEQFLEAITLINAKTSLPEFSVELTLIGNLVDNFDSKVIKPVMDSLGSVKWFNLKIEKVLSQTDLHKRLSSFDVGLALEFDSSDLNRQLCLTNKILAYTQAGLYVLATNTPAQQLYMLENPESGLVVGQTAQEMATAIVSIGERIREIRRSSLNRFRISENLAWENQEVILKGLIKSAIVN